MELSLVVRIEESYLYLQANFVTNNFFHLFDTCYNGVALQRWGCLYWWEKKVLTVYIIWMIQKLHVQLYIQKSGNFEPKKKWPLAWLASMPCLQSFLP